MVFNTEVAREHKAEIMHTQILGRQRKLLGREVLRKRWMAAFGRFHRDDYGQCCSSLDGESATIFLVVEQSKGVMQEDRTVLHLEYTWIIELIAISDGNILTNCNTVATSMHQAHLGQGSRWIERFRRVMDNIAIPGC